MYLMFVLKNKIRPRHRWALISIGLLLTVSMLLMQYFISLQRTDSEVINIAGKQRMLSQQVALYSVLSQQEPMQGSHYRTLLASASAQFISNHDYLVSKDDSGQYLFLNEALEQYYFSPPVSLDKVSRQFYRHAEMQLEQSRDLAFGNFQSLEQAASQLLARLDGAVKLFEQAASEKVALLAKLEILFWLLMMILLVLQLLFVFQPMESMIDKAIAYYRKEKQRSEQMGLSKDRFIARVSHEFRTPLQGLLNAINELELKPEQSSIREQAQRSANRLVMMLDELSDFHQLSTGQWHLTVSVANLQQTLTEVITSFDYSFKVKGLTLVQNLSPNLNCDVKLDHARLIQMCHILLSNALKYTVQGKVTLSARLEKSLLILEVKDSGVGFKGNYPYLANQEDDTEHYFQGLQTSLARVQYLLSKQNAKVEFSDNLEQGACVCIQLPVEIVSQEQVAMTIKRALIVEDENVNALILAQLLTNLGIHSDHAKDGDTAVKCLAEDHYDVIFMDLNMPVMDGFEAIKVIRQDLNCCTPIVVVTANTAASSLQQIYQLGATYHLFKPISEVSLANTLKNLTFSFEPELKLQAGQG